MLKLIIGNKAYSSWSLRGWLAAKQSGLPFEEVVVSLYDAAWPERKAQPDLAPSAGKVPILWNGGTAVWESIAIIDHLDDLTGGTRFWPQDLAARGLARSMAAEMHAGFVALRRACPMNTRRIFDAVSPSSEVADNLARIAQLWAQARADYGGSGDFLFGAFGAADIMYAPVVSRIVSYQLPVPAHARAYVDAIMAHRWMQDWIAAAQEEDWVLDQYEAQPVAGD
ncbi:glutathione S-transferase family protein [Sphingobium algorifonticola]|uniref:Glutathione S-transferase family protein n=1 Tax=Sphingobium algorifonticola TaxID=2008318 RepID=A0A437J8X9_9SPHN|nr:glutathione S-transferase family protein [Sphingobium algorifonticola]RVT41948.1 glutathione S-transferase family protein [Sphingobium algorifonticola]